MDWFVDENTVTILCCLQADAVFTTEVFTFYVCLSWHCCFYKSVTKSQRNSTFNDILFFLSLLFQILPDLKFCFAIYNTCNFGRLQNHNLGLGTDLTSVYNVELDWGLEIKHQKAHNYVWQGCFFFHYYPDDQLSWNFHRFVILSIHVEIHQVRRLVFDKLPIVSSVFNVTLFRVWTSFVQGSKKLLHTKKY